MIRGVSIKVNLAILLLVCGLLSGYSSYPARDHIPAPNSLQDSSLTVLINNNRMLPLKELERGSFVFLGIGRTGVFASRLGDYLEMPSILPGSTTAASIAQVLPELKGYDRVIAGISAAALPGDEEFREVLQELIRILESRESVVVFFGTPLQPENWEGVERVDALLVAGGSEDRVQDLAAQAVFGAIGASGRLSCSIGDIFPAGSGISTAGGLRLRFPPPGEAGFDGGRLTAEIDSIVNAGLAAGAFPGCRVLVALGGEVIVDTAYGYHTFAGRVAVEKNDLYDLASVTKISGPLPVYMKLVDEGRLDIDRPLSDYWDGWQSRLFRRSNKQGLVLRDVLAHQAGIVPYINFWEETVRGGNYIRRWYRHQNSGSHSLRLGGHLYLRDSFRERVYRSIRRSELLPHGEYRYSCLPFIISPEVIAAVDGREYTTALYEDFYRPLGAVSLRYNPLDHFPAYRIVPTEYDHNFRRQLVHGYVHDEAAAVLGGVSGNAGLFSTAGDLAKLMQMYLNGGEYGGRRYLSEEVLREFTRVQFPENDNRRGLGFDKPLPSNHRLPPERAYPSHGASASSFGHSGFTGTFVWMDPRHDLLYIFLSNRVHPTRANNLVSSMSIRTGILQVVYDSIKRKEVECLSGK
jgi:CubicO group peptidase (beta-lactamase class C family)